MNLRPFQIILLGIFLALAIGGTILFSVYRGFDSEADLYGDSVEIWGTLDRRAFVMAFESIRSEDDGFGVVEYIQKSPRTFRDELVNAIAENRGPDAVVLPQDLLVSERAKLYPIPYETLSLRDIRDTYIDGAEIFSLSDGTYGFPFAVDPLVMYWNRDMFSTAGLAVPPTTWETVISQTVPLLTKLKQSPVFAIDQTALAFGEYANVKNATGVLMMLLLQAGSPLVTPEARGYRVLINYTSDQKVRSPGNAALDFYTQFANPAHPLYTWNRSMPIDRNVFLAGDLGLYFGYGSEFESLRNGNPNLNFDAAQVPQGSGVSIKKGFGTFYALSILRSSNNFVGTYRALARLAEESQSLRIAEGLGMAPVHRRTLLLGNADPFRQMMYTTALIARGFLNPNPPGTETVIKGTIEDVTSGRASVSEAISDAEARLYQLLP